MKPSKAVGVDAVKAHWYVVAIVEQESEHHLVVYCVLDGSGKLGVIDQREVAVNVGTIAQKQAHKFMIPCPHRYEEAGQWILVLPCVSSQQELSAGNIVIGHGNIQGGSALVVVGGSYLFVHDCVDIKSTFYQQFQALRTAIISSQMDWIYPTFLNCTLTSDWNKMLQGPANNNIASNMVIDVTEIE